MGDTTGCPAALTFGRAPLLEVRCHRTPGHPGNLHEAKGRVSIHGAPNEWDPDYREWVGPTSAVTWFTWEQNLPEKEPSRG